MIELAYNWGAENTYPALAINSYVWNYITEQHPDFVSQYNGVIPIYPIYDATGADAKWKGKPYIVYDSLLRINPGPFYPMRKEQLMYQIKGDVQDVIGLRELIINLLNRGDDAGKDINEHYCPINPDFQTFIECVKCFQINFTNEETKPSTNKQNYVASLIVEYEYHPTKIINDGND